MPQYNLRQRFRRAWERAKLLDREWLWIWYLMLALFGLVFLTDYFFPW